MKKSAKAERRIIAEKPAKRRYGARLHVQLGHGSALDDANELQLELETGHVLNLRKDSRAPWETSRYVFEVCGFATARAAEAAGSQLALVLLWTAVSLNFPLRLRYSSQEPAVVFDRTQAPGAQIQGYASVGWSREKILDELSRSHSTLGEADPQVLLSMELFAGAACEVSERARFVAMVSALEPLAQAECLEPAVDAFVTKALNDLSNAGISPSTVDSVRGRLEQLRKESIGQAIRRVVRCALPDCADAVRVVTNAYALRSQILHSGRTTDVDVDLGDELRALSHVIRRLYAARLGQTLAAKIP